MIAYHAAKETFDSPDPERDETGLGFFMTEDLDEAFGRFVESEDDVVLAFECDFKNISDLDGFIESAVESGRLLHDWEDLRAEAEKGGYSVGQAACRNDFGRDFNLALRRLAKEDGVEAFAVEDWVVAIDAGGLTLAGIAEPDGSVEPISEGLSL